MLVPAGVLRLIPERGALGVIDKSLAPPGDLPVH